LTLRPVLHWFALLGSPKLAKNDEPSKLPGNHAWPRQQHMARGAWEAAVMGVSFEAVAHMVGQTALQRILQYSYENHFHLSIY
jgi:hypothetical protein